MGSTPVASPAPSASPHRRRDPALTDHLVDRGDELLLGLRPERAVLWDVVEALCDDSLRPAAAQGEREVDPTDQA